MKNYYKILGIQSNATSDQINAAYEKLLDWQERFSGNYSAERKRDIDEAFDMLSDPAKRKEVDTWLAQQKVERHQQEKRVARQDRDVSPPSLPKPRNGRKNVSRITIGFVLTMIFLAIRMCVRSGVFESNEPQSRFIFSTSSYNTPRPTPRPRRTQTLITISCDGTINKVTYGYNEDRTSVVSTISAGTPISYRLTGSYQWYELIASPLGTYIRSTSVTQRQCVTRATTPGLVLYPTLVPRNEDSDICWIVGPAKEGLIVYPIPDWNSDVLGQITPGIMFLGQRDADGWFIILDTLEQPLGGGYVRTSQVEVLGCSDDLSHQPPTAVVPFGG